MTSEMLKHIVKTGIFSLADLPVSLCEGICTLLSLRDRVALTSCSSALWSCQELQHSRALWGNLSIRVRPNSMESFQRWLSRHRAALRCLRLQGKLSPSCMEVVFSCYLLEELYLLRRKYYTAQQVHEHKATGQALPNLKHLTTLALSGYSLYSNGTAVPFLLQQLEACKSLRCLSFNYCALLRPTSACDYQSLLSLSHLSHLDLSCCDFGPSLPSQLPQLPELVSLKLNDSSIRVSEEQPEHAQPLWRCTGLTNLELSDCNVEGVPDGLQRLSRLARLDLSNNMIEFSQDPQLLAPLLALPALKWVNLHMALQQDVSDSQAALLERRGIHVVLEHASDDEEDSVLPSDDEWEADDSCESDGRAVGVCMEGLGYGEWVDSDSEEFSEGSDTSEEVSG